MPLLERLLSLIDAGGWVMYPLIALSVLSLAVTLERTLFWLGPAAKLDRRWLDRALESLRTADWPSVTRDASDERSVHAAYASRLASEAMRTRSASPSVAVAAAERFRPAIERFAALHATIITAAPMLGILGTVTGIIRSFRLIGSEAVVSDPAVVASGIAEALFTTAFGLVIALLTLFPHALFRARAEGCLVIFESIAAAAEEGAERQDPVETSTPPKNRDRKATDNPEPRP